MESDSDTDIDRLDELAEEFLARYRQGERPSLSEFIALHPDLADQIRELFPTLAVMEQARVESSAHADNKPREQAMRVPERIGEYSIIREVGRGGMGIVYEAMQESLGRHVALKILPTHALLDPRQLKRFQREARAAARLHHTNIVPVFGVGSHEGLNFYAMQFIRGSGLDQVLVELKRTRRVARHTARQTNQSPRDSGQTTRGPASAVRLAQSLANDQFSSALPLVCSGAQASGNDAADKSTSASKPASSDYHFPGHDRSSSLPDSGSAYWLGVARVGVQVADALAYANSQGVLHRDIKPSNLLLDADGTVWVTDFGLAKDFLAEDSPGGVDQASLTRTGDIVGTLRYMAPELLKGRSDPRSDIYSLGATLYELLTLRAAFDEADRNVFMRRLLHDEPPRPRSIDSTIPIDLETIVVKSMSKEPEDRYGSAAELAEDLRRFLADRPIRARRISTWERTWRTCRRNPLITSLSAVVIMLIALLTAGFQMAAWIRTQRDSAVASAGRALAAEHNAQLSLERALDAERDATVRAHLTQAIVQRKRDEPGRRIRGIEQIEAAMANSPAPSMRHELRNELVATLALTDTVADRVWESPHGAYAVDAQFKNYARMNREGRISVLRLEDDQLLRQLQREPGPDSRGSLKFSPDGAYLASFTFDQRVMVWRLSNGDLVLDDVGCCWEMAFDFTPDSRSIVVGHDQEMVVYDLQASTVVSRWPVEFAPWCVACAPTNDWVAITPEGNNSSRKLQVYCWSTQKLAAEHVAPRWVFDIAWHPDGENLAYGCGDTNIYLWKVGDAQTHRTLSGSLAFGVRVAFSHDGKLLASSSWGQEFYLWEPHTGEKLCSGRHAMLCLQFSPDDSRVALFRDGSQVGTCKILRSDIFRYFARGGSRGESNAMLNAVFSRDGALLLVGTEKGISICEYPSGTEKAFAPVGRIAHLRCDGDGNLLTAMNNLLRWPLEKLDDGHYLFGPVERLPIRARSEFDVSQDGRVWVVAGFDEATIIDADRPNDPVILSPHEDCRYVGISRDGKLAATASHFGSKVKVWDTASGRLLVALPVESSWANFSPDGRWLATPVGARHLWKVGTWEPGPDLGGLIAGFSEDGRLVAVDDLVGSVHLLDPDTGREYVRLEHPQGFGAERYLFTPDGRELVAVATARPSGFAWSLDRIREALVSRGLDWDLPGYSSHSDTLQPVTVKLRADLVEGKSREQLSQEHIQRCRKRLEADPSDALTCNELAWELLIAPVSLRDSAEAVRLATRSLELKPGDMNFRNTLGVALYREARYREATECLAENLPSQADEGLPFDLYFLAMSHFQLGDERRAQEMLIWANRCQKKLAADKETNPVLLEQLSEIRREAEQLIEDTAGGVR